MTLANKRGRVNFLSLTELSGFVVENYSTPCASGSSAASLADLVVFDPLMARAPPDLDPRVRFVGAEGGDVSPGLAGVLFLPWSRIVGGHSPDGHLRVREDGDCSNRVAPGGRHL